MAYAPTDDIDAPRLTPAVRWLIAANVAVYFLQLTVVRPEALQAALGFQLRDLSVGAYWTIATYMFVHVGLWHLLGNMLVLFVFGPRVEHAWSSGEFTRFYLWCGLGGWFFHLLFARNSLLVGASAAVLGVMVAYASRWPDDEVSLYFTIPVKVKWLVLGYIAYDALAGLWGTAPGTTPGVAHLAHLGGVAAGWLYLRTASMPNIDQLRQRVSQLPDLPDDTPRAIPRSMPRPREKLSRADEAVAKSKAIASPQKASPGTKTSSGAPDLDAVLDKISQQGLESLSNDERRLLEDASTTLKGE